MSTASTNPVSNDTLQLFMGMGDQLATVTPDHGESIGGGMPPNGDYDCQLIGMTIKAGSDVTFGGKGSQIPGGLVGFRYKVLQDPTSQIKQGHTFNGEWFRLPLNPAQVTGENWQKNVEITMRRLAGFIECILGRKPSANTPADLAAMKTRIDSTTPLILRIRVSDRPEGNYRNAEERAVETLSS